MLSNVLPGLREIRAPLTAGYIWLIAAWLLFHSSIPTEQEARGSALEPFFGLGGVVSSFGFTVVLSVLAYLIGSLSEGVFRVPIQAAAARFKGGPRWDLSWRGIMSLESLVQDRVSRVSGKLEDEGLSLRLLPEYEAASMKVQRAVAGLKRDKFVYVGVMTPWHFYPRHRWGGRDKFRYGARSHPTWVKVGSGFDQNANQSIIMNGPAGDNDWNLLYVDSPEEIENVAPGRTPLSLSGTDTEMINRLVSHRLAYETKDQVFGEMLLVGTRLLGKETDLFHEFDRQRGESTFRLVIIPPLLVLTIVLAIEVNSAFLFLLGSVPLFYWQGVRYRQEASDVLIDSLVAERVEAPSIEKLERAAARAIALAKRSAASPTESSSKNTDSPPAEPRGELGART